jgi:hypothetical protein
MIRQLKIIAPETIEGLAYHAASSLLGDHPGTIDKRRIMAHVLRMAATQNGDWVSVASQAEFHNGSFHDLETKAGS